MQSADESLSQLREEMKGAAQKGYVSTDGFSAGQTADGLVDHCLENGSGQILPGSTVIDQGLDIGFGKYTAAGCDGINSLIIPGVLV